MKVARKRRKTLVKIGPRAGVHGTHYSKPGERHKWPTYQRRIKKNVAEDDPRNLEWRLRQATQARNFAHMNQRRNPRLEIDLEEVDDVYLQTLRVYERRMAEQGTPRKVDSKVRREREAKKKRGGKQPKRKKKATKKRVTKKKKASKKVVKKKR